MMSEDSTHEGKTLGRKDNSDQLYSAEAGKPPVAEKVEETPEAAPPRVQPNADLILLKRLTKAEEEKTKGGIILPSSLQKDFFRAEVVAMGEGAQVLDSGVRVPPANCKIGDIVLVQDEVERRGPNGQRLGVVQKHLIPVTPDDRRYVLCPGCKIYAIELKPLCGECDTCRMANQKDGEVVQVDNPHRLTNCQK
jgi:chaperonin GroES